MRQKQPFADDLLAYVLKDFAIFTGVLECWKIPVMESLFNNVAGLKVCNFIRKRLHHRCFLVVNIVKF